VTPITGTFLVLNTLLWLIYLGLGQPESWKGAFLIPNEFSPLALLTSQFIHQSTLHLALNMLLLWAFGRRVESGLGSGLFTVLYLGSGVFAGLLHVAVAHVFNVELDLTASGASGAVAGVMGAYASIYPGQRFRIPRLGVDVAGVTIILAWLAWEAAQAIAALQRDMEVGVGHWAHVGGLVCGLLIGPLMYGSPSEDPLEPSRRPPPRKRGDESAELPAPETNPSVTAAQGAAAAVERLTRIGERTHALALYGQAIAEGRALHLPGPVEFHIAVWLTEQRDWAAACDAFLSVAHSEREPELAASALFRALQLAEEHLRRPQLAERLRQELRFRFPQSRWTTLASEPPGGTAEE
jgi:membrane associated rhomboid family serine protease